VLDTLKSWLRPTSSQLTKDVWLVVGLGNPGSGYSANRHNIGQMVVDELAAETASKFKPHKSVALVAQVTLKGHSVVLAKSTGYMNTSGGPVQALMTFFKVPAERLIVIHDELDIPFGDLRTKIGGGHAGHNGLRDIIARIGQQFHRVRFGIGRPPGNQEVASFVLSNFNQDERTELPRLIEESLHRVELLVSTGQTSA
jgi:peptidyl-tRNA hydrolase, PTH1 family